jgi:hypothetical protein
MKRKLPGPTCGAERSAPRPLVHRHMRMIHMYPVPCQPHGTDDMSLVSRANRARLAALGDDRNRPQKHVARAGIILAAADRPDVREITGARHGGSVSWRRPAGNRRRRDALDRLGHGEDDRLALAHRAADL